MHTWWPVYKQTHTHIYIYNIYIIYIYTHIKSHGRLHQEQRNMTCAPSSARQTSPAGPWGNQLSFEVQESLDLRQFQREGFTKIWGYFCLKTNMGESTKMIVPLLFVIIKSLPKKQIASIHFNPLQKHGGRNHITSQWASDDPGLGPGSSMQLQLVRTSAWTAEIWAAPFFWHRSAGLHDIGYDMIIYDT